MTHPLINIDRLPLQPLEHEGYKKMCELQLKGTCTKYFYVGPGGSTAGARYCRPCNSYIKATSRQKVF